MKKYLGPVSLSTESEWMPFRRGFDCSRSDVSCLDSSKADNSLKRQVVILKGIF